jgi:hypothetical protein
MPNLQRQNLKLQINSQVIKVRMFSGLLRPSKRKQAFQSLGYLKNTFSNEGEKVIVDLLR